MQPTEIENLYRKYGPSVYRRAMNMLYREQEAQEVLQDVFTALLTKGDSFRSESSPMTWLYAITTNLCLNRIRNRKRHTRLLSQYAEAAPVVVQRHPELWLTVQHLLKLASKEEAQAAVYYYFDNMTHQEIAKVMNCSRRKVGDLIARFGQLRAEKEQEQ